MTTALDKTPLNPESTELILSEQSTLQSTEEDVGSGDAAGEKRKREGSPLHRHPLHKTSLCSYFRRDSGSCSHGEGCRYAHGESELRPRPDGSWDPTSGRAQKMLKSTESCNGIDKKDNHEESNEVDEIMMTDFVSGDGGCLDASLSKCLIHLPRKWGSDQLKNFLRDEDINYKSAKKKKGMTVGFVCFESAEQLNAGVEDLKEKSFGNKNIKIADVIPRTYDDKIRSAMSQSKGSDSGNEDNINIEAVAECIANDAESMPKGRTARDVVTPLAHMSYRDQLDQKKSSIAQMLKKLTRNARKACPDGVPLPEWILKSREIGGLPCIMEGIIESPLVEGYRNKCEFSVGCSLLGKPTVGFLLGNFREGVTAVGEPADCRNVSSIACKYASIFQEFLQLSSLPIWNRFKNTGFWRQLTVREGRACIKATDIETPASNISEVLLIVQISSTGSDDELVRSELLKMTNAFATSPLPLTCVVVQDHKGISNVAPADAPLSVTLLNEKIISEIRALKDTSEARIHDHIRNLKFSISPTAFFQVNTLAAEKLYSLAGDWAGLGPNTLLFDICCGTGTIGLFLAHQVGLVVGIEMNSSAVEDAERNAEINGIRNCRFVCGKAEDVMGSLLKEYLGDPSTHDVHNVSQNIDTNIIVSVEEVSSVNDKKDQASMTNLELGNNENCTHNLETNGASLTEIIDNVFDHQSASTAQFENVVAIVDPPRGGLHPTVIRTLRTHSRLRRVVYISCNPETLVANAIELCTPSPIIVEKGNKGNLGWRRMSNAGLARHRAKSMPVSEPFRPVKAMAVDLFPHTVHCEMVMLLER